MARPHPSPVPDDDPPGAGAPGAGAPEVMLPAHVRLAWGIDEPPSKGPKRGLSLEAIVAAAIELADAEGHGAVSMARVAARLGSSPMGLYRYVSSKEDLIALMIDVALGPSPRASGRDGWRAGMRRWAIAERAAYLRHPWGPRVPIAGPPILPNHLAWLDDALQCFAGTGLTEQEKLSSVLFVSGFVRNSVLLLGDLADGPPEAGRTWGRVVAALIDPVAMPGLGRALASGSMDDDEDDEGLEAEFEFGLERALDGIERLVDERAARAAARATRDAVRRGRAASRDTARRRRT